MNWPRTKLQGRGLRHSIDKKHRMHDADDDKVVVYGFDDEVPVSLVELDLMAHSHR